MPPKLKSRVGKLAQSLRRIKDKPRKEEDESDLIEFEDDDDLTSKSLNDDLTSKSLNEPVSDEVVEISDPVVKRNELTPELKRIAQLQNKIKDETKLARDSIKSDPPPKIRAADMAKLIKEAVKEQLAEELKQRDNVKEQRRLEKEKKQMEKEKLESDKEAKRQALKEEKNKLKMQQERQALEQLRVSLEKGIKQREENLANALSLSIRKARSSVLLS